MFHQFLFQGLAESVGVLNIGGMANLSVLQGTLIGFDTGPGNVLLDLWIEREQKRAYDREGLWAKEGKVDEPLLKELLGDPYFVKAAPKSTGRELFNAKWLDARLLNNQGISPADVQATLLELSVYSIAREVRKYGLQRLLVCGGGVKNSFLMLRLAEALEGVTVETTDDHGVSSSQMEAMLFAWLGYKRIHREPVALKTVTGAKKDGILGGLYAKD